MEKTKMVKMPSIESFIDDSGKYRFRVKARNGEIVCQSEAYSNKRNCNKGIEALTEAMWQYECGNIQVKHTSHGYKI